MSSHKSWPLLRDQKELGLNCGFRSDRGEGAKTVHGVGDNAEVQAALCEHRGDEGWACWIGVSGAASLTCWASLSLIQL